MEPNVGNLTRGNVDGDRVFSAPRLEQVSEIHRNLVVAGRRLEEVWAPRLLVDLSVDLDSRRTHEQEESQREESGFSPVSRCTAQ